MVIYPHVVYERDTNNAIDINESISNYFNF